MSESGDEEGLQEEEEHEPVSFSPREPTVFKKDEKTRKSMGAYLSNHRELLKFRAYIEAQILDQKPESILDFLINLFAASNSQVISEAIALDSEPT